MLANSIELPNVHSRLGSQVHKSLGLRKWRMLAPELVRRSSGQHETTLPCTMAQLATHSWANSPPPTNTRAGRKTRRPKRKNIPGITCTGSVCACPNAKAYDYVGPHKSTEIHGSSNATSNRTRFKTRVQCTAGRTMRGILNSPVAPRVAPTY